MKITSRFGSFNIGYRTWIINRSGVPDIADMLNITRSLVWHDYRLYPRMDGLGYHPVQRARWRRGLRSDPDIDREIMNWPPSEGASVVGTLEDEAVLVSATVPLLTDRWIVEDFQFPFSRQSPPTCVLIDFQVGMGPFLPSGIRFSARNVEDRASALLGQNVHINLVGRNIEMFVGGEPVRRLHPMQRMLVTGVVLAISASIAGSTLGVSVLAVVEFPELCSDPGLLVESLYELNLLLAVISRMPPPGGWEVQECER